MSGQLDQSSACHGYDPSIPEVHRPAEGRPEVHIPWREGGSRRLIKSVCGSSSRPEWDGRARRWLVARAHFLPLVEALKAGFGQVRVITMHSDAETCGTSCQQALGDECTCSCGGASHGIRSRPGGYARGWRLSGTTATFERGWSEWMWVASSGMNAAETAAYVVGEAERLTRRPLPVPGAEQIIARFIRRYGAWDATMVARAAIEIHKGMWVGAPITPRRFTRSNDGFFARRVLVGLDGETQTTRVA